MDEQISEILSATTRVHWLFLELAYHYRRLQNEGYQGDEALRYFENVEEVMRHLDYLGRLFSQLAILEISVVQDNQP